MADAAPVVHIGENSPEKIAFRLLEIVASVERKLLYASTNPSPDTVADRKWVLDTYAECIDTVRGNRGTFDARWPTSAT